MTETSKFVVEQEEIPLRSKYLHDENLLMKLLLSRKSETEQRGKERLLARI